VEATGIAVLTFGWALARRGSPPADGGRKALPALLAALSFMLALAGGVAPVPAEARDLVMFRTELRRGELSSCDATACRLDSDTIPRQSIAMIGLGDPPLPMPTIRNPSQDELHLQDGSVRPGPLVSLDARRVITRERTFERREVRWIYLAYVPPSGDAARKPSGSEGEREGDGTCRFWVGMLRQGVLMRNTTTYNQLHRTVRTVYAARFKETSGPIVPGTTTVGTRRVHHQRAPEARRRRGARAHAFDAVGTRRQPGHGIGGG
jgi:hypothetical protein